ncbi:MAG: oxidoreductase [Spirosomataceae bacterium]
MNKSLHWLFLTAFVSSCASLPHWETQKSNTEAHFRAVHAVSRKVCWVSGTKGSFLKTTDGGVHWQLDSVRGAHSLDFRDIHAFDSKTALVMSAGEAEKGGARIYKTVDGGTSWNLVFETLRKGVFFDAMDFWDEQNGIVFSDSIDGKLFILTTSDGGESWQEVSPGRLPAAITGEGGFAASGSCLVVEGKQNVWIGTTAGRVYYSKDRGKSWSITETPIKAGKTSGIFGLRFKNSQTGFAVGGDYQNVFEESPNVLITTDGGRNWSMASTTNPVGLKEAVVFLDATTIVAVGPSGTCYSTDLGKTWQKIDASGFHSASFSGKTGWAVGSKGIIAKFKGKIPKP